MRALRPAIALASLFLALLLAEMREQILGSLGRSGGEHGAADAESAVPDPGNAQQATAHGLRKVFLAGGRL
jgi:hypothetical protein